MIIVLDNSFNRLSVIKNAIESTRLEEINGENILDFSAVLDEKLNDFIDEDTIFELDDDYFDTALFKKVANEDNTYTVDVESEHVSYRLNDPLFNVEFFTELGEPSYILGKILEGTGFTIGTIEFSGTTAYSAQEAKSRRQLLMEFVAYLGGEVIFHKFEVSIVQHRGSLESKPVIKDRNVKVVSKTLNKRQLDELGNFLVSYTCTPIFLGISYDLGDNVRLMQKELGINEELRVISISRNPYNEMKITFQFANYENSLASSLYRIEVSSVLKDKFYNGTRIGPEYGFENVRGDKLARSYFRADEMKFQSGDGSGTNWKDRLYFEYDSDIDETILVLDGKLSATMINALSAIITPNLYAEKATISELTVDELDTSDKIRNYLVGSTADVNYIRIYDQTIKFITAAVSQDYSASLIGSGQWDMVANQEIDTYYTSVSINQTTGAINLSGATPSPIDAYSAYGSGFVYRRKDADTYYRLTSTTHDGHVLYSEYDVVAGTATEEQATNRKGELMYWIDDTHEAATTDETDFPVMQYIYNEAVKQSISFEMDSETGFYTPVTIYGTGTGTTSTSGQARQRKNATGLEIAYTTGDGEDTAGVYWRDDGFVDVTARRADIKIDTTAKTIAITPEGDNQSDIIIDYVESGNKITMTWPDGESFDVEVT